MASIDIDVLSTHNKIGNFDTRNRHPTVKHSLLNARGYKEERAECALKKNRYYVIVSWSVRIRDSFDHHILATRGEPDSTTASSSTQISKPKDAAAVKKKCR